MIRCSLPSTAALVAAAFAGACRDADVHAASDELAPLARPYAYVQGEDGPVALGPLRDGRNTFVLPLATTSERVPRALVTARGFEVLCAAGRERLGIESVRLVALEHAPSERVAWAEGGPVALGPPTLPVGTAPERALPALARLDGLLWPAGAPIELERPVDANGLALAVAAGAFGRGDGALQGALTLDGVMQLPLGLGPNDVLLVHAAPERAVLRADVPLDAVHYCTARLLTLAEQPAARLVAQHRVAVTEATLARTGGLGVWHPLPLAFGPPEPAATGPVTLSPGAALAATFEPAAERSADRALTFVLEVEVRQGGLAAGVTEVLTPEPRAAWFRDAGERELVAGGGDLLVHFEGPDDQRDIRPTMGPGAAWGDIDGDGWMDLYLVQGGGRAGSRPNPNRLLRNLGATRAPTGPWFEDVTARAGVGDTGAGMGALFVDLDGDGDVDLYVANYGRDALYLNRGDGTFDDARALLPDLDLWSAGVAAADTDGDGDLDLYVTSYLEYDLDLVPPAAELGKYEREDPVAMLPFAFPGQRNVFLANAGPGPDGRPRLTDATEALGLLDVAGRGMQPLFWDFDRDGDQDLYVANDVSYNVLHRNEGNGTFTDVSFATGLDDPRGGMGLAAGDVDADGDEDVLLTNWQLEANALYINSLVAPFEARTRRSSFHDAAVRAGFARASVGVTSWGIALFDLELDGDLDTFIANGYTSPDYVSTGICVGQPNHLLVNDGSGRFSDGEEHARGALEPRLASRGAVGCDFDRDGDVDLLVTNNNGPVQLFVNEAPRRGTWLGVTLRQAGPNRAAIGAEVTVETRGEGDADLREHRRALRAGEGYLTGNPAELHFGLGDARELEAVLVRWPDGEVTRHTGLRLGAWQTIQRR